jgi:hypothetical protein
MEEREYMDDEDYVNRVKVGVGASQGEALQALGGPLG